MCYKQKKTIKNWMTRDLGFFYIALFDINFVPFPMNRVARNILLLSVSIDMGLKAPHSPRPIFSFHSRVSVIFNESHADFDQSINRFIYFILSNLIKKLIVHLSSDLRNFHLTSKHPRQSPSIDF